MQTIALLGQFAAGARPQDVGHQQPPAALFGQIRQIEERAGTESAGSANRNKRIPMELRERCARPLDSSLSSAEATADLPYQSSLAICPSLLRMTPWRWRKTDRKSTR